MQLFQTFEYEVSRFIEHPKTLQNATYIEPEYAAACQDLSSGMLHVLLMIRHMDVQVCPIVTAGVQFRYAAISEIRLNKSVVF
jgi:hypothetical protein